MSRLPTLQHLCTEAEHQALLEVMYALIQKDDRSADEDDWLEQACVLAENWETQQGYYPE
jgi:hypothetical protein